MYNAYKIKLTFVAGFNGNWAFWRMLHAAVQSALFVYIKMTYFIGFDDIQKISASNFGHYWVLSLLFGYI